MKQKKRKQLKIDVVNLHPLLFQFLYSYIEANHFIKCIAASLAIKWEKSYSETVGFVRTRLSFAILRSASLCLQGSRVKWRCGLGFEYGAALPAHWQHTLTF